MSFVVDIPSVITGVNHGYQIGYVGGHPRIIKHKDVEPWQIMVARQTRLAKPSDWVPGRRVRLFIWIWFNRLGRDADGILKFLLDGVAAGLGVDDTIFLPTVVASEVDRKKPRIHLEIVSEG